MLKATSSSGTLASLMPPTMRVLSFTALHSPQQLIANSSSTITTSTSSATGSCSGQGIAPVFIYQPIAAGAPAVCHSACVELDALAYVPSSAPLQRVHAALAACLQGQLAAARRVMLQEGKVLPVSSHFIRHMHQRPCMSSCVTGWTRAGSVSQAFG